MGDTIVWTILLKPQPNCTINGKKRKYFFIDPKFFKFVTNSPVIGTQAIIFIIAVSLPENLSQLDLNFLNSS